MSQIYKQLSNSGPFPPTIATQYTENGPTIAVPAANNLNVLGGLAIVTTGSGSTITIDLRNFLAGSATTVGAVTADAITLALGATPATYSIDLRTAAFESVTPSGAGYNLFATVRTDGVTASLVGTPDKIINEDAVLITGDVNVVVSGNNAILRVLGVAGLTINWRAVGLYTSVS